MDNNSDEKRGKRNALWRFKNEIDPGFSNTPTQKKHRAAYNEKNRDNILAESLKKDKTPKRKEYKREWMKKYYAAKKGDPAHQEMLKKQWTKSNASEAAKAAKRRYKAKKRAERAVLA